MPMYIKGERYNMEKMEGIARKKLQLTRQVEELLNNLKEEFINENNLERKEILDIKQMEKFGFDKSGQNIRKLMKLKQGGAVYLVRDMAELGREYRAIEKIANLLQELMRLTRIEEQYFGTQRSA